MPKRSNKIDDFIVDDDDDIEEEEEEESKPKTKKSKLKKSDSSDEDDQQHEQKQLAKPVGGPLSKNDDGDSFLELSNTRRVTVRSFKGNVLIDIREFYSKDGKSLPGKKGISLSKDQWNALKDAFGDIDQAVGALAK
ncbi:PC4-domain-containing protein [Meredithblackwellia eburnea MCA 4105]